MSLKCFLTLQEQKVGPLSSFYSVKFGHLYFILALGRSLGNSSSFMTLIEMFNNLSFIIALLFSNAPSFGEQWLPMFPLIKNLLKTQTLLYLVKIAFYL